MMETSDRLHNHLEEEPLYGPDVFVAPTAVVVGDVQMDEGSSLWYGGVLRGDINSIKIGKYSNLQDGVIGHLSDDHSLIVGTYVTVGHGAVIHACEIGDECLIGMNSTILDGVKIGRHSVVAAGSVVPVGMQIPEGSLVAGVPAKVKKSLSKEERERIKNWAEKYLVVAKQHREKLGKMRPGPPA
jgi:carbonic anhydrase/acetyltransferase-like protein (isoleucine patch superfamily)